MTSRLQTLGLRRCEWVLLAYFAYSAIISPFFQARPELGCRPLLLLAVITVVLLFVARLQDRWNIPIQKLRDWLPIAYTFLAFREMEFFLPKSYNGRLEASWIKLDVSVLGTWHLRAAIEKFGSLVPTYLELCYLLVYAVAPICVSIFYFRGKRSLSDEFWTVYFSGTLVAYSLFPYFPSQPPRIAFPAVEPPTIFTWIRGLNLAILNHATIHSGVFPSAHVSSVLASAWAMFTLLPDKKRVGWLFMFYAASVAVATVYGRYHYTADVIAGCAVSIFPVLAAKLLVRSERKISQVSATAVP